MNWEDTSRSTVELDGLDDSQNFGVRLGSSYPFWDRVNSEC